MDDVRIGQKLEIHSYKHNKKIHRTWDEAIVLDIKDDYIVCGNNRTLVTESDGRKWKTKEPAIIYFFKDKWYNVICQLKDKGIYYYCNIASPYIIDGKYIKYIDYDLDLRVFPDGAFRILDRDEYKYHRHLMEYSKEIDTITSYELSNLIDLYKKHDGPFKKGLEKYYYSIYLEYSKKTENV